MNYPRRLKILKAIIYPRSALITILVKIGIYNKLIYPVDYIFDYFRNIETSKRVANSELDSIDAFSQGHATHYAPVPVLMLWMLRGVFKKYNSCHFIDIGCGKGRVCFYAAKIFRKVSGIDFSLKLINEARRNLENINKSKKEIEFILADARQYILPNEKCVIFIYNPFDDYILKEFLLVNKSHFKSYKSIIIYVVPEYTDILICCGFVQLFDIHGIHGYVLQ